MTTVLLVGTGQVAIRAARQLVDTDEIDRVLVASRDASRASELAAVMGGATAALAVEDRGRVIPEGVDAVALATVGTEAAVWLRAALDAGVAVATVDDDGMSEVAVARAPESALVTGCGLEPGLADVLARHAADTFDSVDEVHIARAGASGPACVERVRAARRETPGEWRDGTWQQNRAFGPELLWFPEPVGARECQLVWEGVMSAVASVPTARHVTVRTAAPPPSSPWRRRLGRDPLHEGWGAVRTEVTGWRDGEAGSVVYGMVDRTEVVAGVVLAIAAAALAGAIEAGVARTPGCHTLGAVTTPVPFLAELAHRGVTAAAFEGVVPH